MSVAIRTATRIQDMDDANVTPGVGVDEYVLTYDHDTAKFVLRAPVAAPDLSGYALLAGRAGGQTLYGGTGANDDITIHGTSDATRTTSYVLLQPTAGNVGIGTTTPIFPLEVYGVNGEPTLTAASTVGTFSITNQNNFRTVFSQSINLPYTLSIQHRHYSVDGVAYPIALNPLGGNVGIGTVSPGAKLQIDSGTEYTGIRAYTIQTRHIDGHDASTNWGGDFIYLNYSSPGKGVQIGDTGTDHPLYVFGEIAVAAGIRPHADSTTAIQLKSASGVVALSVDTTNSRIGIGATEPATRLDIDAGALTMKEMTAPTGVADKAMLYTKDSGAGKTQLCCKLGDNVEIVIATQA